MFPSCSTELPLSIHHENARIFSLSQRPLKKPDTEPLGSFVSPNRKRFVHNKLLRVCVHELKEFAATRTVGVDGGSRRIEVVFKHFYSLRRRIKRLFCSPKLLLIHSYEHRLCRDALRFRCVRRCINILSQ